MKRNLIGILWLVVMAAMLGATASAQTTAKANVPFAFKAGSAQLPAGTYKVNKMGDNAIMIESGESRAYSVIRRDAPKDTGCKLVFHRVAGQYFLAEIWGEAGSPGMVIPTSKQEKSLQKELRASGQPAATEEVLIALN
jgi:hypothetical protein